MFMNANHGQTGPGTECKLMLIAIYKSTSFIFNLNGNEHDGKLFVCHTLRNE